MTVATPVSSKDDRPARSKNGGKRFFEVAFLESERWAMVGEEEATLLKVALDNRIPIIHECGGHGRCTTCRVRVLEGHHHCSPKNNLENRLARKRNWDSTIRLGCQMKVHGPVKVERLVKTLSEISPLQKEQFYSGKGEEKQLAILFCDLRNFTPFVESQMAFDVVHIMNKLFAEIGEPILMNNGIIYQYVGDEIVGLFGIDNQDPTENCLAAVRSALGMKAALERLNKDLLQEFGVAFEMGAGIHFGSVVAGQIGHPSHMQFGIIGDAANVASRVQSANKTFDTHILVSEDLLQPLPEGLLKVGKPKDMQLKGKSYPIKLSELIDFNEPDDLLLVQSTAAMLFQSHKKFASAFYKRLFEAAPQVRAMFQGNMEAQEDLLGHMLKGAIYALNRPRNLRLGLRELGRRHVQYGVKKAHFDLVRTILVATLKAELDTAFSVEVARAWSNVIDTVFKFMMEHISD